MSGLRQNVSLDPVLESCGFERFEVYVEQIDEPVENVALVDTGHSRNPPHCKHARETIRIGVVMTDDVEFAAFGEEFVELVRLAHY